MSQEHLVHDDLLPEQILQAALQLYLKHGVKKVTMDDVSKAIGKSRSSLYYYYRNRDDIFDAVMAALIRDVIGALSLKIDKADSVKDKIWAFCTEKIRTSEEKKALFGALEAGMDAEEISHHAKNMQRLHKKLMGEEHSLLKKIFSEGALKQEIRPLSKEQEDRLIFILLSSIRGIRREMRYENDFSQLEPTIDVLVEMTMKWL